MSQQHIAFYLPQFHPIPENDAWWGEGFTEWTSVTSARPRYRGHVQPDLPADLGFYDLRVPEVRAAQAAMAREYGIDGFCYYHYWFGGRRVLEQPFEAVLNSGEPDFPFCLAWANENWTRRWDGLDSEVLLHQDYDQATVEHAEYLARAFADPRYIRVDGKPVFLVYRASMLPDPKTTTDLWRSVARSHGVGEILLLRVEGFPNERDDPRALGFDAGIEFAPDVFSLDIPPNVQLARRITGKLRRMSPMARRRGTYWAPGTYEEIRDGALQRSQPDWVRYPCVMPGWDNTPRKTPSMLFKGSTPELYGEWVRRASLQAPEIGEDSLVFVNAWNEWAEGAHLEPGRTWGRAYLEAHLAARRAAGTQRASAQPATRTEAHA